MSFDQKHTQSYYVCYYYRDTIVNINASRYFKIQEIFLNNMYLSLLTISIYIVFYDR
jgi:hypothetical protein